MTDFEGLRAAVVPGAGIVARFPGIVCVAHGDAGDDAHLRRLLDICREAAGSAPGRPLARRLASWLGGADGPPDSLRFGAVSATGDDGLAVFCVGAVRMVAGESDTSISGTDAAAWADRLLPRPDAPVLLALDGAPVEAGLAGSLHDLRSGVVPGAGVVLLGPDAHDAVVPEMPAAAGAGAPPDAAVSGGPPPGDASAGAPGVEASGTGAPRPGGGSGTSPRALTPTPGPRPVTEVTPMDEPTQLLAGPPPPGPDPASLPRPPRRSEPILGAPAEEARPPLEAGGPAGSAADHEPTSISTPRAQGHLCSRGHLNDPRSHFCVLCGIRMNERTGVLVLGARPPLGLLVFDDGSTYTVDAEYLVGRMPEVDERVASGALRPISVEDRSGAVSRVHAEVRLQDWDVMLADCGSRNGTHVAAPGDQAWTALHPGESRRLGPGTRVRMGGRTFVFESPSGVR
ncbi:MAG: FHA domain-containing protein [Pseudonocardia sp.]